MTIRALGSWHRRRVLATIGITSTLAGCSDTDDDVNSDVPDPDTSESEFLVDHPVDEPKAFSSSHLCGVCSMAVTDYSDRNAQLAHENGDGMMFCSPGCLFAYYGVPDQFGAPESDIVGAWVTDFETESLVDGFDAVYVLEHDEHRTDDPMGLDPRVYANMDDARKYIEQYDDLDEDDTVTLSEVGEDIARMYRRDRLP